MGTPSAIFGTQVLKNKDPLLETVIKPLRVHTFQVTPWPKEVDKHSSLRSVGQHLLLKAVSAAIITPFYSASLVETVQSDIASEKPGVLDVFKDGIVRLVSWSDPR